MKTLKCTWCGYNQPLYRGKLTKKHICDDKKVRPDLKALYKVHKAFQQPLIKVEKKVTLGDLI